MLTILFGVDLPPASFWKKHQLVQSIKITWWNLRQLHFKMVPNAPLAKKKGQLLVTNSRSQSCAPEGDRQGAWDRKRREWELLFSHLSLFLTLSCQVRTSLLINRIFFFWYEHPLLHIEPPAVLPHCKLELQQEKQHVRYLCSCSGEWMIWRHKCHQIG